MDVLSWFKSVVLRSRAAPAPLRADLATGAWLEVPRLRPVLVVPPPPAAPAGKDEDWNAAITRARLEAAPSKTPRPQLHPPSGYAAQKESSPPPHPPGAHALVAAASLPSPPAPRDARAKARMDGLLWGGMKKPPAVRPRSRR
jgi:hypothetical protein